MPTALLWGAVAASSLIVGAVAGVVRDWHPRLIGLVLGFGAGALVASISFELAEEGFQVGGALPVAAGLAVGGLLFYLADLGVIRLGGRGGQAGLPLALGALLDGIPEQAVLGIGVASGGAVSISLLVAIFVSNLPEAIGSADDLKRAGRPASHILAGWLLQAFAGNEFQGGIDGFAAGALLVMLVTSMIPESTEKAGRQAGLAAVLGFAVGAGLSLSR